MSNKWRDLPSPRQAGILSRDASFRRWLGDRTFPGLGLALEPDEAADAIRAHCGVSSRREISSDPVAADRWRELVTDFRLWQQGW
jgi:hypothetical protein